MKQPGSIQIGWEDGGLPRLPRVKWAERGARGAQSVDAAIASFGVPEASYHQHVTGCAECNNPHVGLLCGEGQRLYAEMMGAWPVECYNHVQHFHLCPITCRDFEACRGQRPGARQ